MTQEDTNVLNKYRLNYACLCKNHSQNQAKKDFVKLAKKMFAEDMDAINEFETNFKVNIPEQQANEQVLQWAFRKSFFWDMLDTIPKSTTDPKRLAYLRMPFRDLYRAIRSQYAKLEKRPLKLYIVSNINKT
jgi:hypothetical protein